MSVSNANESRLNALSNGSGAQAIINMEEALGIVLGAFLEQQGLKGEGQIAVGNVILSADIQNANKIDDEIYKNQHESWWQKLLEGVKYLVQGLLVVGTALTGNFELSAMILTVSVLADTGAFKDIAQGIADVASKFMPENDAKLLGDVLTIVSMVGVGLLLGGVGGTGEAVEGLANTIKDTLKGSAKGIGLAAMGAAGATLSLSSEMASTIVDMTGATGKEAERLQALIALLIDLTAIIGGVAGGITVAVSGTTSNVAKLGSNLGKAMGLAMSKAAPEMAAALSENAEALENLAQTAQKVGRGMRGFGRTVGGASKIATAGLDFSIANIQEKMGDLMASLTLLQTDSNMNNTAFQDTMKRTEQVSKAFEEMLSQSDDFQADEAAAEILLNA